MRAWSVRLLFILGLSACDNDVWQPPNRDAAAGEMDAGEDEPGPGEEPEDDAEASMDATESDGSAPEEEAGADAETADGEAGDASVPACEPTAPADLCGDGMRNGGETDVDCGGPCTPCLPAQQCERGADCSSGHCDDGACTAPPASCYNAVRDGSESDVDCGGDCVLCSDAKTCNTGADCRGGRCAPGTPARCASTVQVEVFPLGEGSIRSGDGALMCPETCSAPYVPAEDEVALTALPGSGRTFAGWFGSLCPVASREASCTAIAPAAASAYAHFVDPTQAVYRGDRLLPRASESFFWSAALDGADASYLAGVMQGTTDVGAGPMAPSGSSDAFMVSYAADGAFRWVRKLGGAGDESILRIALKGAGGVVALGTISSAVSMGGAPLACPAAAGKSSGSFFLAEYDPANGAHRWSRCLPAYSAAMAVDDQGDIVVAGEIMGPTDLGGGPIAVPDGESRLYVTKYSGVDGAHVWDRDFPLTRSEQPEQSNLAANVAVALNGDVVLSGSFRAGIDFGAAALSASPQKDTLFLARLNADGPIFARQFAATGRHYASSLSVTSDDDIVIGGSYEGSAQIDCASFNAASDGGVYVASFHGMTGALHWIRPLFAQAVNVDARDAIVLAGDLLPGANDLGFGRRVAVGPAAFVAKLDLDGSFLWQRLYGAINTGTRDVRQSPSGDVLLLWFSQTASAYPVDWGGGARPLTSQQHLLLRLGP